MNNFLQVSQSGMMYPFLPFGVSNITFSLSGLKIGIKVEVFGMSDIL